MSRNLSCFKAYDVRGKVPDDLNEDIAFYIGKSFANINKPNTMIVGYDARLESPSLAQALSQGLASEGVKVIDIGLCGTEEVYFQTFHREKKDVDGGIMITASHNPKGYNGMKFVGKGSQPIYGEAGLSAIQEMVEDFLAAQEPINLLVNNDFLAHDHHKDTYINHLLTYIDLKKLAPLKIVVNPGNGTAGAVIRALENHLPFEFIFLNETPDASFPKGVPNPLLPEMRYETIEAVQQHKADLGIAWDGDFDRCFFFTEKGEFVEGYYIVGLLAESFLKKEPGQKIIYDPRLTWNTEDIVKKCGGIPVMSRTGHAFLKSRMRQENAIYGGEMSAHHYFKDFAYCDSGMIPWLLITELLSITKKPLSHMIGDRQLAYPCSGEINYSVASPEKIIEHVYDFYKDTCINIDRTDGLSMAFTDWRFNLRLSNTESLLRLNVETKKEPKLLRTCVNHIEALIRNLNS